jgi:Zn-dependent protease
MEFIDILVYLCSISFVLFCATPLHEFAHALIAVKLGDDTPRLQGRLTINPTAHIDPIGAVLIFLFGFGYAKPVSVRMRKFKNPKVGMALVALAGPVCNLIQALISLLIVNGLMAAMKYMVLSLSMLEMIKPMTYICMFFFFAAQINVNLAVFNLLPVPPLDGSRIATVLIPQKYYFKIMQYERYIMYALLILLFLNVLDGPLVILSDKVFEGLNWLAHLPFSVA